MSEARPAGLLRRSSSARLAGALAGLLIGALAVTLAVPAPGDAKDADPVAPHVLPSGAGPSHSGEPGGDRSGDRPGDALAGRVVVIDPGHQLGNHNFPRQINRLVPAGGFKKPCNTTGTSTNGGYPEASFNWRVALLLKTRLERAGARVIMTRTANLERLWGPCVDERGRAGNRAGADLKISIHGDGAYGGGPGFHVIVPTDRRPWTHDIYRPSKRMALILRRQLRAAGLPVAGYTAGGDGLDFRSDLATLNLSDVPTVMLEAGNMRSAADARRMTRRHGRVVYAQALARAVRRFLR